MNKSNIFYSKRDPREDPLLYHISRMISREAQVSEELIRQCEEESFKEWEDNQKKNISAINFMNFKDRTEETERVIKIFDSRLKSIIPSDKKFDKSAGVADSMFKSIFHIY